MDKWIITYCTDEADWNTVTTVVVEASSKNDVEENLIDLLAATGIELAEATTIFYDGLYFIRDDALDINNYEE